MIEQEVRHLGGKRRGFNLNSRAPACVSPLGLSLIDRNRRRWVTGLVFPLRRGGEGKRNKVVLPFLRHRGDSLVSLVSPVSLVVDLHLSGRRRCADCCLFYSVALGSANSPHEP